MPAKTKKGRESRYTMYMKFAALVANQSTCRRNRVGAVITDKSLKRVLSIGYNGNYSGGPNKCDRIEEGSCGCLHAEINALIKCDNTIENKVMFVTTSPCKTCAKAIINSGFGMVCYAEEYRNTEGLKLLQKNGILTSQEMVKKI